MAVNDESLGNVFSWLYSWLPCQRFEAGNRMVNYEKGKTEKENQKAEEKN